MDDYIDGLKEQQQQQDKDEIKKLKATIEKQAIKLRENYNEITKLKDKVKNHSEVTQASLEGALQLRELLMSEHQGSTVGEMLGFCFKDITRDRDENAIMKKKINEAETADTELATAAAAGGTGCRRIEKRFQDFEG